MRVLRVLTLLLVAAVAAGPTLLDRCLISCHDESKGDAVPTCHEHASDAGGLSVHGVDACGHDHDGSPADTLTDARGNAVRHADVAAGTPHVSCSEPPRSAGASLHQGIDLRSSSPRQVLIPLRV